LGLLVAEKSHLLEEVQLLELLLEETYISCM
jgi:hypothetical protein